jgi:hypothetical protein
MSGEVDLDEISDLSDAQNIAMAAGAFPSALLSLGGSLVIIYTVVQTRGHIMGSYECILLGLSVCDIILTVSWTLAPFLTPKDASQRITALGNDATCNMGGFLWQFSYSTYWYNGLLSFYYLTTIVYGWSEDRFKKLAPYLHGLCIGFPLVTAFWDPRTTGTVQMRLALAVG